MNKLPDPQLSYPPAAAAALECTSYLNSEEERACLLQTLRDNYCVEGNSFDGWRAVVRTYFQLTTHIYCAAFIAQSESEAEIDHEVECIARELADEP